jgi:hypothetical protein
MDHSIIILGVQQLLGIKNPVDIRMTTSKLKGKRQIAGWYEARYRKNRIIRHVVFINLRSIIESKYSLTDVIAHEIVHAAQFEYGIFDENKHHDSRFIALCEYLQKELRKMGVILGELYNPAIDTD